ncbi:MAG TPA: OsmC family protein [Verrucomicrobiae bacterium]|nr:OsmC family protein [Verrucomicrobiae bacterium]
MAVVVHGGLDPLAKQVEIRSHHLVVDEGAAVGGADVGPSPHDLLDAALASCTALTLNLYGKRKGWPIQNLRVEVTHTEGQGLYEFHRRIQIEGDLDECQRTRLLAIAEKCPIHRVLGGRITIDSELADA